MAAPSPRSRRTAVALAGAGAVVVAVTAFALADDDPDDTVISPAATSTSASPSATAAEPSPAGESEPTEPTAESAAEPAASAASAPRPAATSQPPAPAATSAPQQQPPPPPQQQGRPTLVLEPDGLGVVVGEASIRRFPFEGTDAEQAIEAVRRALGEVTRAEQPDCGPGLSSVDVGGFSLLLQADRVVGWADADAGAGRTTGDGIGVGSTLAELRESQPRVDVADSSIGVRWTSGAYSGLLDGDDEASSVTRITAGQTCSFD